MFVSVSRVKNEDLSEFLDYIPNDMFEGILRKRCVCYGIRDEKKKPHGAIIASLAKEPEGDRDVIVFESILLDKQCNDAHTVKRILEYLLDAFESGKIAGIVVQICHPYEGVLEGVVEENFRRLQDGNTTYEASVSAFIDNPLIAKDYGNVKRAVCSVMDLSLAERTEFLDQMGSRFPKGLSPEHLPGKWLPSLSFVYKYKSQIVGYILSSALNRDTIYVGALYVEGYHRMAAAALIGSLGKEIYNNTSFGRVMFTSASSEGEKLCKYMIKGAGDVKQVTVHNYYREV